MSYTVERVKHGILVRGPIPVTDLVALTKRWTEQGFDTLMPGIAGALKASLAVCQKDKAEAWEKEVEANATTQASGDVELAWLKGPDTGTSSKTIFSVLSEQHGQYALNSHFGADVPHDPDDFGRCFRLLDKLPHWKARLGEVAAKYPEWGPMVAAWAELESLWHEESPKLSCPKLYRRMQELREQGKKLRAS